MVNDIDALLERVKAATGPDRNLDAMLHHWALSGVGTGYYADSPSYTASIDAALALTERVLPGSQWSIANMAIRSISDTHNRLVGDIDMISELPLAIIAATLSAIINRGAE